MPAKKAAKSDKKTKKSTKGKKGRVGLAIYIFRIIRQVGGKKFGVSSRGMGCDFLSPPPPFFFSRCVRELVSLWGCLFCFCMFDSEESVGR